MLAEVDRSKSGNVARQSFSVSCRRWTRSSQRGADAVEQYWQRQVRERTWQHRTEGRAIRFANPISLGFGLYDINQPFTGATEAVERRPPDDPDAKLIRPHWKGRQAGQLDAELAFLLLEDDETAGAAHWATEPSENGALHLLSRLKIIQRFGRDSDTHRIVCRDDDTGF